jgi:secondary thiamine-phosphate synthase enzyme
MSGAGQSLGSYEEEVVTAELARTQPKGDVDPHAIAPSLGATALGSRARCGPSLAYGEEFVAHTEGPAPRFFDVTELVGEVVQRSGVEQGQLVATTAHTTCALIVQENEPLLLADLAERLCRFASADDSYLHNRLDLRVVNVLGPDERANGHSHCQHALLGAGVALPVVDGRVVLGRWQRILLVELDGPRPRRLTVQVTGVGRPDDAASQP